MQDRRKIDQFTPEPNLGGQIKVDWGPDNPIIAGVVLYTTRVEEFADHPFNCPFGHIHFPIKCFMRLHCELLIFFLTLNLKHDIVHPQI